MANTTIDTLEVKITASAQSATASLKSLAAALTKVKTALSLIDKNGISLTDRITHSLNAMNGALNTLNTSGIKKIQKLANGLNDYADAIKRLQKAGIRKATTPAWKSSVQEFDYTDEDFKILDEPTSPVSEAVSERVKQITFSWKKFGETVKEAFGKFGKSIKSVVDKFKEMSLFSSSFIRAIGRIALYRAFRSALKAVSEAFSEGLKNAYQYSKQSDTFKELAETLDYLKSVTSQLVNQLGAFWGEFRQFIQPALTWLIENVRRLSEYLTELFAALNGKDTYLRANLIAKNWDEATEAVKKYKQQLLGLDELNNLSDNSGNGKAETNYGDLFEEVSVSAKLKQVGMEWQSIKRQVEEFFSDWHNTLLVGIGGVVLGSILLFGTSFKKLGLGLIIGSGYLAGKEIAMHWDELKGEVEEALTQYRWLFAAGAVGLTALGAALLFTGYWKLGLGCIIAGGAIGATTIAVAWKAMYNDIEHAMQQYRWLFAAGSIGLTALGAGLMFTGHWALGISCVLAGVSIGASTMRMSWELMYNDIQNAMQQYRWLFIAGSIGLTALGAALLFTGRYALGLACILGGVSLGIMTMRMSWTLLRQDVEYAFRNFAPLFAIAGVGSMVVGCLLLFSGNIPWGLGLLMAGGFLTMKTVQFNWDSLLEGIKDAWKKTKDWIDDNIFYYLFATYYKIENLFKRDLNSDGSIGWPTAKEAVSVGTKQLDDIDKYFGGSGGTKGDSSDSSSTNSTSWWAQLWEDTKKDFDLWASQAGWYDIKIPFTKKTLGDLISPDAMGAIEKPGTLFYAGEAGPEFIGRMGNSSAVANTEQMTDAIYKAAYMGMSQALRENGGNGLAGFVPATTDDLFIAMRKKASNYNKATGSSAFA